MNNKIPPTILVIVGITGDLSSRKLLPAIEKIVEAGAAPRNLKIVGVTRRDVDVKDVLKHVTGPTNFLENNLELFQMDLAAIEDYQKLVVHLTNLKAGLGDSTQILFYLSVPPQISLSIIELLGESGVSNLPDTKLLMEKPFGTNLESAGELIENVKTHFSEEQVYRIDHYLAKEMTQNLVVFRQGNSLIRRTWNKDFIECIEIVASEKIDIEGRAEFYEQTGALRDLVQSHLLQLAALTLAEFAEIDWENVPKRRLAALQQLQAPQNVEADVVRGQYRGYREEVGNAESLVETFVSIKLSSTDPQWQGVPITITTGKALPRKTTEIIITYRQDKFTEEADILTLHIQPDEGVELGMWAKEPGYDRKLQKLALSFKYGNYYQELPEAYERVLLDAMKSDHSLFTTSEEVLETWRILEPIQKYWEDSAEMVVYEKNTTPAKLQKPYQ